jgi:glycosyltransferase involved in cell wall biosynthesis
MKRTLSVIIPTLNRPSYLSRALKSIAQQTLLPFECIIVDQSSNSETKNLFETFDLGPVKKTYVHQKVKSLIKARNNGLDHAGPTDFICFLDDDLELLPDFFEVLIQPMLKDGKYAGGMGTFEGRQMKKSFFPKLFQMPHDGHGQFLANGFPTYPHWKKKFSEVEFLSGGITMYRSEVIKRHRYDERLIGYGYGDDADVSYRISRRHKLYYEPRAKCIHDDHSTGRDPGILHRKQLVQNMYYLLQKNVGITSKSTTSFGLYVVGQIVEDLFRWRKGAFIGNFLAIANIAKGNLDSVQGYKEYKAAAK